MSTVPPPTPTQRASVKVWGAPSRPHWSVTIYLGDEREELAALVDLAIETHALVGERYAERRRAPKVHVPERQEERE